MSPNNPPSVPNSQQSQAAGGTIESNRRLSSPGAPLHATVKPLAPQARPALQELAKAALTGWNMAATLAVAMIAFSVAPLWNHFHGYQNKDYNLWYWTGRTILEGSGIYPTDHRPFPFMYPPACASMLAIGTIAGETPFVFGLLLLNSAAWIGSILLAVYLATGRTLRQNPYLYLVPTLVTVPFVHDMYLLGQPNLLLLLCMLGGFALLRLRLPWLAGACIAMAAAIKAFPILAIGYLVYRRQVKATLATVATLAFLLIVLPMPMRGVNGAWHDVKTWTRGMLLKYDKDTIAQRPERSYSFKNQSIIAVSNRLLRSIPADGEAKDGWQINIAALGFKEVNTFIVSVSLAICGFYILMMPRYRQRTDRTDAIEMAMLLLMIVAFNPLAFDYSYVWLLYPVAMLLQLLVEAREGSRERKVLLASFWAMLLILSLALPFRRMAQAYGNLLIAGMILLVILGWQLRRSARAADQSDVAIAGV